MPPLLRRAVTTSLASVLTVGLVGLAAPAAVADDGPVPLDIVAIKATPQAGGIISRSMTGVSFTTTLTVDFAALGTNAAFFGDLYRGTTLLERNILLGSAAHDGSGGGAIANKGWTAFDNRWGRGTFRLRNVRIEWYAHPDRTDHVDTTFSGGSFTIRSSTSATASVKKVKGSTKKKRLRLRARTWGTDGRWHGLRTKASIQRKKGGTWRTVARVRTNAAGRGAKVVRYAKKARYRVVIPTTSTTAGKVAAAGRA